MNLDNERENLLFNLVDYCDNKMSKHENDTDPDLNFFNNLVIPNCDYLDLEDINSYFNKLNIISQFNILHCNCRSIYNKTNEINLLATTVKANIIAVTETWIENEIAEITHIDGYKFEHKSRAANTKGGGVGFFIENNIIYEHIDPSSIEITTFEYLVLKINCLNSKLILICIYRPPNTAISTFTSELEALINKYDSKNKVLIIGDFNINLLNTHKHEPTANFNNMLTSNKFLPLINKPTRITEYTSTLIDNFFSNYLYDSMNTAVIYNSISDHLPILLTYDTKPIRSETIINKTSRIINDNNISNFISKLQSVDWSDVKLACSSNKPDIAYSTFLNKFTINYHEAFPTINHSVNNKKYKKPWMTKALFKSIQIKNRRYKKYLLNPTSTNKNAFNKYNNNLKKILKLAEKNLLF